MGDYFRRSCGTRHVRLQGERQRHSQYKRPLNGDQIGVYENTAYGVQVTLDVRVEADGADGCREDHSQCGEQETSPRPARLARGSSRSLVAASTRGRLRPELRAWHRTSSRVGDDRQHLKPAFPDNKLRLGGGRRLAGSGTPIPGEASELRIDKCELRAQRLRGVLVAHSLVTEWSRPTTKSRRNRAESGNSGAPELMSSDRSC
jgi:hypothetical protein